VRAVRSVGCIGMRRPPFFFCDAVVQFDGLTDLAGRIQHHVPRQPGDLARPQAGLDREQHHQLVAKRVAGGGGEDEEVVYLLIVKNLRQLAGHLILAITHLPDYIALNAKCKRRDMIRRAACRHFWTKCP
jgi:hypothetical protein